VIEGQRCDVLVNLYNPTNDVLIVSSIYTNRNADEEYKYLRSQYGELYKTKSGQIIYNTMAQMATGEVCFDASAVVPPHRQGSFLIGTRFFGQERKITLMYYRIPVASLKDFIFAMQRQQDSFHINIIPVWNISEIENSKNNFVLWKGSALKPEEASFSLNPDLKEAPFSLKTARGMLPREVGVKEISYCATFDAWVFKTDGAAWLVRKSGAEKLDDIELLVFEKIDSSGGKEIVFRVPENEFAGKYTLKDLESGNGTYMLGKFLTVSGEKILTVFRTLRDAGLACRVQYYYFTSWYLDVKKP
jgi:hypothetical protein